MGPSASNDHNGVLSWALPQPLIPKPWSLQWGFYSLSHPLQTTFVSPAFLGSWQCIEASQQQTLKSNVPVAGLNICNKSLGCNDFYFSAEWQRGFYDAYFLVPNTMVGLRQILVLHCWTDTRFSHCPMDLVFDMAGFCVQMSWCWFRGGCFLKGCNTSTSLSNKQSPPPNAWGRYGADM